MEIYKVTCKIDGKSYVGKTTKTKEDRWYNGHCKEKNGRYFVNAIKKYNSRNFIIEHLCDCETVEILDIMETFMIMVHHTHISEGGYNLTWGGDGGDTFTNNPNKDIIRITKGTAQKRRYENPEERKKTGDSNKKRYENPEEHKKQSEIMITKYREDPYARKKTSIAMKKYFESVESRKYHSEYSSCQWKIIDPDKNEFIIDSLPKFCQENGLSYVCMTAVGRKVQKHHKKYKCEKLGRRKI